MKNLKLILLFAVAAAMVVDSVSARKYDSYKGLVMAGYQGWAAAPDDGSGRGWGTYAAAGDKFYPGECGVDFWPEMDEYEIQYESPFRYADGSVATVYSPHDYSSVDLHFKWMKENDIDGVFMQRFMGNMRPGTKNKEHFDLLFDHAMKAAQKYGRTVALMYDLSGFRYQQRDETDDDIVDWAMVDAEIDMILKDWAEIAEKYGVFNRDKGYDCYLHHNGKPLLAIWGIGFPDRPYPLTVPEKLVKAMKSPDYKYSCTLHLGVPTYWREFGYDTRPDPLLHDIIRMGDIIHPWTPGRYSDRAEYEKFKPNIAADIAWANANGKDYAVGVYPGFSWYNKSKWMFPEAGNRLNAIPRDKGRFFWMQLEGAVNSGAEMLYISMFDEIEEGTAVYKLSKNPPVGPPSQFVALEEDVPSDHYMWLCGQAAAALKKGKSLPVEMPFKDKRRK